MKKFKDTNGFDFRGPPPKAPPKPVNNVMLKVDDNDGFNERLNKFI